MNKIVQNNQILFDKVVELIEQSRRKVKTVVNTAMVYTYYNIGRYIVEYEQQGAHRAQYGKAILQDLSARLTSHFGEGWSYPNLRKIRQFYLVYSNLINSDYQIPNDKQRLSNLSNGVLETSETSLRELEGKVEFTLSWSHYLILMGIENPDARRFYEIEAAQQNWSVRQPF